MTDKEIEFAIKLMELADKLRYDVDGCIFKCHICEEKAVLKIKGDRRQEICGKCENCKIRFKGVIYD
ncbi:hypothetical protein [Clostridium tertium]